MLCWNSKGVSKLWQLHVLQIALFFAIGQGASSLAPILFGILIQSGRPIEVFYGNLFGAALMAAAGIVAIFFGVKAERQSLESIARPLSFAEDDAA